MKILDLPATSKASMTFKNAYNYADFIFSSRFEGIKLNTELTDKDIKEVNTT